MIPWYIRDINIKIWNIGCFLLQIIFFPSKLFSSHLYAFWCVCIYLLTSSPSCYSFLIPLITPCKFRMWRILELMLLIESVQEEEMLVKQGFFYFPDRSLTFYFFLSSLIFRLSFTFFPFFPLLYWRYENLVSCDKIMWGLWIVCCILVRSNIKKPLFDKMFMTPIK